MQMATVKAMALLSMGLCLCGCNNGPPALSAPSLDPSGIAEAAMEMFDTNSDGRLDKSELASAHSIRGAMSTIDANSDKAVTPEELEARVQAWIDSRQAVSSLKVIITLDGRPLKNAEVIFTPAEFMGDSVKLAKGTTDKYGSAYLSIPKDVRGEDPPGVNVGLYKVTISRIVGGKETLPAKFNTETTLGRQISRDEPAAANGGLRMNLKSK